MGNVVQFNGKTERIWVCNCGCSTFELIENRSVRCASCEQVSPAGDHGAWFDAASMAEDRCPSLPPPQGIVRGSASGDAVSFARAHARRQAMSDDAVMIVSVDDFGVVSSWCADAGKDREALDWHLRKLDEVKEMLRSLWGED